MSWEMTGQHQSTPCQPSPHADLALGLRRTGVYGFVAPATS